MQTETTPQKPFNPMEWARILASQTGVDIDTMDEETKQKILAAQTKTDVNITFFHWRGSSTLAPQGQFELEDMKNFREAVRVEHTLEYQQLVRERAANEVRMQAINRDLQTRAEMIARQSLQLLALQGQNGIDLTDEVLKITQDGWYTFDSGRSRTINSNAEHYTLVFNTPRVNLAFYNKQAGVEMNVDMGRFRVHYTPQRNRIQVFKYQDNLEVRDGYYHPHVSTDNSVCWGNAGNQYVTACREFKPSIAFNALRVILQTYNDESPYRDITEFALARNPDMFKDKKKIMVEEDDAAWFEVDVLNTQRLSNIDENWMHEEYYAEDDDGNELVTRKLYSVWVEEFEGTGVRVPGTPYYLRNNDGSYVVAPTIYDWN